MFRRLLTGSRWVVLLLLLMQGTALAEDRTAKVTGSLVRAAKFLASRQGEDGAWRSGVHGSFKDGQSLSPLVMASMLFLQGYDESGAIAFARGRAYLFPRSPHDPPAGISFPIYTHSISIWVLGMQSEARDMHAMAPHLAALRALQLNRANGWSESDPHFGGWGYHHLPRKTANGEDAPWGMPHANISATVFAIGALRLGRVPADDGAWRDVRFFVERCQNFSDASDRDTRFDDGGFIFSPEDAAANKPGQAGIDRSGKARLHSYGSATADGVRCLVQIGLPQDHPRVIAARRWLIDHFETGRNPGTFNDDRQSLAHATKYYWLWSAAHAMKRLEVKEIDWRGGITDELLKLQREDGSWKNDLSDGREDDPLVATSFAAAAMMVCR